ncbi:MAG TPA: hydroxymethylbilane synthase [Chthoniobacteraceae bacterium]|jgi:hydroxymethylbilane synthase
MKTFVLGTRGSALALAQAELTRKAIGDAFPDVQVEQKVFVTRGDLKLDLSLSRAGEAGGKGLFTRELEEALLAGTIDVAVHSLKDLPGHNPAGLEITAVLERAPISDVLITKDPVRLDSLPFASVIGTSSVRRARQLKWLRNDLSIEEWRGNVQTRLRKLGESELVDGIVLAQAGLERLGFRLWPKSSPSEDSAGMRLSGDEPAAQLPGARAADAGSGEELATLEFPPYRFHVSSLFGHLLPAIGQGAIALQSRANRPEVTEILQKIDHRETHLAIRAERALQRLLSGDCAMPIGVRTMLTGDRLSMKAILFGEEGEPPRTAEAQGDVIAPEVIAAEIFAGLQKSQVA